MLIFSTKGKITVANDKSNLIHRFDVPENINKLIIKYTYSPKTFENREKAVELIRNCFDKYDEILVGKPSEHLPVKNLITLSIDENGNYRGAAHRQDNEQEHIISADFASPGFIKGTPQAGDWDIILNAHCVCCDVDYCITVEGEIE